MTVTHLLARQRGFTLVEAIMVIVITGILAGMMAIFIVTPVRSYLDSSARADLSDTADLALRRMSREIRLALPNSLIANGTAIQFLITKTGGRYLSVEDAAPSGIVLSFVNASSNTFDVVGAMPSGRQQIVAGDSIVVYNVGVPPAEAYAGGNRVLVSSVAGNTVTMASNIFPLQNSSGVTMNSPNNRFQVITGMVTYICANAAAGGKGTLTRYFTATIPSTFALAAVTNAGTGTLLASQISSCNITYAPQSNHSALINIGLTMERSDAPGVVSLTRQVHVDNTP